MSPPANGAILALLFATICAWIIVSAALTVTPRAFGSPPALFHKASDFDLRWSGFPGHRAPKIRVMVVGDSISQGHEGDWTWRYRLWQWFKSQNIDVDFVGPYNGTRPPYPPMAPGQAEPIPDIFEMTRGGYAAGVSPEFDSKHFAVWGRTLAEDKDLVKAHVQTFSPDYLLVQLGFNDMGWSMSNAQGTLDNMKILVDSVRAAKPNLKFAVANVAQRTFIVGRDDLPINTDQYNKLLRAAIPSWSTPTSPIEIVDVRKNYACEIDGCPVGHDGLHPNALGEYQIAQAFSRALHSRFRIGRSILKIPTHIPERPAPVPSNFKVVSHLAGITITWDAVYGAFEYGVRHRLKGANWDEWRVGSPRYDSVGTHDGEEYQYQVRTYNSDREKSKWTRVLSAVAHPNSTSS